MNTELAIKVAQTALVKLGCPPEAFSAISEPSGAMWLLMADLAQWYVEDDLRREDGMPRFLEPGNVIMGGYFAGWPGCPSCLDQDVTTLRRWHRYAGERFKRMERLAFIDTLAASLTGRRKGATHD